MSAKRKREPSDYREYFHLQPSSGKRPKSVADYGRCSAQQQTLFRDNAALSPLLRLPAEIRNEIYGYVLSNQVIHISVRECPKGDTGSWSHADYKRIPTKGRACMDLETERNNFLKLTHTLCTLPFDEEDDAYMRAMHGNRTAGSNTNSDHTPTSSPNSDSITAIQKTSYRIRHEKCYHTVSRLKNNWLREGNIVTVSPGFKQVSKPSLSVAFLQTCRQIYIESRDLIYTSNTFAFHEGDTLDLFVSKCLSPSQRGLISSLQLDGWNNANYDPGRKVQHATLRLLTGVKSCRVAIMDMGLSNCNAHLYCCQNWRRTEVIDKQKGEGRGDVVKVTVDQAMPDTVQGLEWERVIKLDVESAFGI